MLITEALHGVIVTELGTRTAVGACGSLLAQLGATVVAVEPEGGRRSHRPLFTADKLSFVPKAGSATDTALLRNLLNRSDVILTSSDVDPMRLQDLTATTRPVICNITAFGATGAYAGRPWTDYQVQALSGIADTTGFEDGPPIAIEIPITDFLTATYAAGATVGALRVRRLSGIGQAIDMALFDCGFAALSTFLSSVLAGSSFNISRLGNRHQKVAPWNLYRSLDGWALICAGNQAQWQKLCDIIGRPNFITPPMNQAQRLARVVEIDAAIEQWTSRFTTAHCVDAMIEAGIACGPIAPIDDRPREANIDYRNMVRSMFDPTSQKHVFVPRLPIGMASSSANSAIPAPDAGRAAVERLAEEVPPAPAVAAEPRRVLEGVRLIEIGQYTTAPLCTRHLAHLGAEVIKIEPLEGAESRAWPPTIQGTSVAFSINNADKRCIAVDLRSPHGAEVLTRLIETADILVENLKPGSLARLGFSAEQMARINPKLVYCAISGFGADSLYASRPAFDMVIQAMAGFMTALNPGRMPVKSGISTSDLMGAEMAILAVIAALEQRDRTGHGQYIDLSMQDISAWLTQTAWNGEKALTPSMQRCRDGYVLAEAQTETIVAALKSAEPPRSRDELETLSRDEAAAVLCAAGIASAPVLRVDEAVALPHTIQRGLHYTMHENGADWPMLASPLRLLGTPAQIRHLARHLNQDGSAILAELGLQPPPDNAAPAPVPRSSIQ
jgi:crotonobetainyl-CoA:carnitine CoA-transferase CaiB-like acyl-CoA transferase